MNGSGQEERDMDSGAVGIIAATLVLGLIFSSIAVALFYVAVSVRTQQQEGALEPPIPKTEAPFPKPQLQVSPAADLARFRAQEDAVLNGYRWVDRQAGVVAIPIERAMDLLVKTGTQPLLGTPGLPEGPTWQEMLQRRAKEGTAAEHADGNKP